MNSAKTWTVSDTVPCKCYYLLLQVIKCVFDIRALFCTGNDLIMKLIHSLIAQCLGIHVFANNLGISAQSNECMNAQQSKNLLSCFCRSDASAFRHEEQ